MLRLIELDFFSQFLFAYLDLCYLYQIQTRAVICDFQKCGILTSVDSDEPVQPPVKLRNSKLCSVSRLTVIECSHIPHCWKSHVRVHNTIEP